MGLFRQQAPLEALRNGVLQKNEGAFERLARQARSPARRRVRAETLFDNTDNIIRFLDGALDLLGVGRVPVVVCCAALSANTERKRCLRSALIR